MRYYGNSAVENQSFGFVVNYASTFKGEVFITRPEWDGVHFYGIDGEYYVLMSTGSVLRITYDEIYAKDKCDWMVVEITDKARSILNELNIIK